MSSVDWSREDLFVQSGSRVAEQKVDEKREERERERETRAEQTGRRRE